MRCQDASKCETLREGAVLSAVVSDGAGSATFGGEGAAIVCRTISQMARAHFAFSENLPTDDTLWSWVDEIRDQISLAASKREIPARQFSATLVATIVTAHQALIYHVGDGAVALRLNGEWKVPSWPETGEYASTTYFVTDEPSARLRITRVEGPADAVAAFSDGLERLALNFTSRDAHIPFFTGIFQPVAAANAPGRDRNLSAQLARYLDSPVVNERTDDDKTLVLAARK